MEKTTENNVRPLRKKAVVDIREKLQKAKVGDWILKKYSYEIICNVYNNARSDHYPIVINDLTYTLQGCYTTSKSMEPSQLDILDVIPANKISIIYW